ncbi:ATP-binding protein [Clostridium sp.]|uniref:AAA family ATPase n=1 Tax=Clostridium sp. TaxID=1506 RepID=UPI002638DB5C|nr:ATP-binding protein [Clostridium sp.]
MIIEIRAKNCFAFEDQISISMKADMRNKKFSSNVYTEKNFNVLKTIGIYGANNSGKTCIIKCIRSIKNVLLQERSVIRDNIFTDSSISELGITFLLNGNKYSYDFKYDTREEEFIYEKFIEITKDTYGNEKDNIVFLKDCVNEKYEYEDEDLKKMIPLISKSDLLFYQMDVSKFKDLQKIKTILREIANKIEIIDMNNIPMKKTIEMMKNKNKLQDKVVGLIKNADLYLEDFKFLDWDEIEIDDVDEENNIQEKVLNLPDSVKDYIRLASVYKGVTVPSMGFDSTGTKKITALASYIIESLEEGKVLVVDELDSSIHFKLTRAIVAMFNNELNKKSQLIFTVHDINLMDCKRLLRKEQIWFVHKDTDGFYLYSLAEFTAEKGVRDTSDIIEKYKKGLLAAIPEPEFINTLIDISEDNKNER